MGTGFVLAPLDSHHVHNGTSAHLVGPALWGDSIPTAAKPPTLQEAFAFLSPECPCLSSLWSIPLLTSPCSMIAFLSVYSFINSVNLDSLKEHIKSSSHATQP